MSLARLRVPAHHKTLLGKAEIPVGGEVRSDVYCFDHPADGGRECDRGVPAARSEERRRGVGRGSPVESIAGIQLAQVIVTPYLPRRKIAQELFWVQTPAYDVVAHVSIHAPA